MLAPPHAKSTGIGPASFVVTNQGSEASLASASSKLTAQLSLLDISDIYILYVASFYVPASYVNLFCVDFLKEKHIRTLVLCYMRLRQATGRGVAGGAPYRRSYQLTPPLAFKRPKIIVNEDPNEHQRQAAQRTLWCYTILGPFLKDSEYNSQIKFSS